MKALSISAQRIEPETHRPFFSMVFSEGLRHDVLKTKITGSRWYFITLQDDIDGIPTEFKSKTLLT